MVGGKLSPQACRADAIIEDVTAAVAHGAWPHPQWREDVTSWDAARTLGEPRLQDDAFRRLKRDYIFTLAHGAPSE